MNVDDNSVSNEQIMDLIQEVLNNDQCVVDKFPTNYASMALDLLDSESITWPQLITLFSKYDSNGDLPLKMEGVLEAVLPNLETQIFRDLNTNLFSRDQQDLCFENF